MSRSLPVIACKDPYKSFICIGQLSSELISKLIDHSWLEVTPTADKSMWERHLAAICGKDELTPGRLR